jgi:integrase
MQKHNANNERMKRRYYEYLKDAKGQSEQTVDATAKALSRFEEHSGWRDFKAFHYQQAVAFKNHLFGKRAQLSGEKLSKATLHATLANLKRFFQWLSDKPGYKSKFQYSDADYFSLSDKDVRIATAKREQKAPTLVQVRHVIAMMPNESETDRRNRTLVAFTLLTGARDSAIASIKLKHVDMQTGCIFQDARDVRTKFSKTFTSYFFPVGVDIRAIVEDWVLYLRNTKLWSNDAPLFPATQVLFNPTSRQFEATGIGNKGWSSTGPIRAIFQEAFGNAGLPYFNPHSFRNTLVQLGESICRSPEDFKAWSQNLGHEKVLTTFFSYGEVAQNRQGEIIQALGNTPTAQVTNTDVQAIAAAVVAQMAVKGIHANIN